MAVNLQGLSVGRGGARSQVDRATCELTCAQCQNVTAAAWHAFDCGTPLNRYITINWSSAGIENARAATSGFLKLAGDWLCDHGVRRAYIWVRENVGGDHVHIIIHVPRRLAEAFSLRQRGWLRVLGAKVRRGVVLTIPVARSYSAAYVSPDYYQHNLDYLVRYLLKGAVEKAAGFTDHRRKPTGRVLGQRAGVSHDLSLRARQFRALGLSVPDRSAKGIRSRATSPLPTAARRSR